MSNEFFSETIKEIDLRKEFEQLLFGSSTEIPKGQLVIFRRMRRKSGIVYPVKDDDLQLAPGVDSLTHDGPKTYKDNWAFGERFLFDDQLIKVYRGYAVILEGQQQVSQLSPGQFAIGPAFFYIQAWVMPSLFDKILELITDKDGNAVSPLAIFKRHTIKTAERFRSDNGRLEYWRVGT